MKSKADEILKQFTPDNFNDDKLWQKWFDEMVKENRVTCVNCSENAKCRYSMDYYNTDGDCLASK